MTLKASSNAAQAAVTLTDVFKRVNQQKCGSSEPCCIVRHTPKSQDRNASHLKAECHKVYEGYVTRRMGVFVIFYCNVPLVVRLGRIIPKSIKVS
jgi:hypothetical protein